MALWYEVGRFPIKFLEIESLKEHDGTKMHIDKLE